MGVLRIGLQIPNFTYPGIAERDLFERVSSIAVAAEDAGFDSLFVMDHFYQIAMVGASTNAMFESYTLLGAIAARTNSINLGTLVTGVTYRNPALLAKIVTTLDVISRGRAILGIGAAWNEEEHEGYGFDFPPVKERMDRLEETLQICRAMFTEETPSFSGAHYRIHEALNNPRPIRANGIPILIGGGGEQRTLRLVAKYADACNLFGDEPTIRHKLMVLNQHCAEIGRNPEEITKTRLGALVIGETEADAERKGRELMAARNMDLERFRSYAVAGDPDAVCEQIQAYREAGLDGMVFNMNDVHDLDAVALAGETLKRAFA